MVRVVRPRVVLEGPVAALADAAVAPPREVPEVDAEVGRDAAALGPEILGTMHARADRAVRSGQCLEALDQLVANRLVLGRRHDALRLPALHVEEQPAVVA